MPQARGEGASGSDVRPDAPIEVPRRPRREPRFDGTPTPAQPPVIPIQHAPTPRNVGARLKGFSHDAMADHPQITAFVAAHSAMDDRVANDFGKHFTQAALYVADADTFAGQTNWLAPLRRRAMRYSDPAVRGKALLFLDNMANMTPERQQALLNMLNAPTAPLTGEGVGLLTEAVGAGAQVTGTTDTGGLELGGGSGSSSVDTYAALKSLFPELSVGIGTEGYTFENAMDDIATEQENLADYVYGASGAVRSGTDLLDEYQQGKRSAVDTFLPLFGDITSVPSEVGFHTAGDIGRSNPYTAQLTSDIDSGLSTVQTVMGDALTPVLSYGLDPNDPNYEEKMKQRMGALAVVTALIPIGVGGLTKKIKTVRSAVSKEAAEAALTSHYRVPKANPTVADRLLTAGRMPATQVGKLVDDLVMKLAKDPEEFFAKGLHGRGGRALLAALDEARKAFPNNPDGQIGFIYQAYGGQLPPEFARKLLAPGTREGAQRVFIDSVSRTPGVKNIKAAETAVHKAEDAVAAIHDRIKAQRTNGLPDNGTVVELPMSDVNRLADPTLWDPKSKTGPDKAVGHMTQAQYDAHKADIEAHGIREPLEVFVNPETGQAVMGEGFHRWRAAEDLGYESVPVKVVYTPNVEGRYFSEAAKEAEVAAAKLSAVRAKIATRAANVIDYAERNGIINVQIGDAGHVRAKRLPTGDIEISSTLVNKAYRSTGAKRGAGIAEALYSRLADEARASGGRLVSDWKGARSPLAESFWEHMQAKGYPVEKVDFGLGNGGERWVWDATRGGQLGPNIPPELAAAQKAVDEAKAAARQYNPDVSSATLQELATRRMEMEHAKYVADTTFGENPVLTLPHQNAIRAIVRQPTTAFQKAVHSILLKSHLFGEGQFADLAKTVDELDTRPELFVPGSKDAPADWIDQNASKISGFMRRAGVDNRTIEIRVGQITGAKNQADFYDILEHQIFGEGGDIDAAIKGWKLDPDLRSELITLHETEIDARTRSVLYSSESGPQGAVSRRTFALGKEVSPGRDIPSPDSPTAYLQRVKLPSVDKVIEANAAVRKAARALRNGKGTVVGQAAVRAGWDVPKAILHVSTLISKPALMIVRLPAMAMRIQMEQGLRARQFGYHAFKGLPDGLSLLPGGIPIPGTNHRILGGLFGDDGWRLLAPDPRFSGLSRAAENSEMGMFMDIADSARPERVLVDTADLNARTPGRLPKPEHYAAVRDELDEINGDWLQREIARRLQDNPDLDPQSILDWINQDAERKAWLEDIHNRTLEASSLHTGNLEETQRAWLDNQIAYVKQATYSNKDLLHYASHHQTPGPPEAPVITQLRYTSGVREQAEIADEITRLKQAGAVGPEAKANLAALYDRRKTLRSEQRRLERQFGGLSGGPAGAGRKKAPKAAATEMIRGEFDAGRFNFPDKVSVNRRFAGKGDGDSVWTDLERYTQGVSSTMYRGMRPLSYVDRHGTRGSLFTQANQRWVKRLEAMGYTRTEAKAIGYTRAANEVKDIMYDLNGRTSLQRATKDLFWFAPATQEVLYTWLVKIPSQAYWPVGMAALASKAVLMHQLLKQSGLIQQDAQGNDVVMASPVGRILTAIMPESYVFQDRTYGKLSGLNLVTQGGGVPGLSIPASFAVGKAALKFGGPFKALSDAFQPYGPEAALLPQPITFLHEALFGEAPPWEVLSPDYTKAQWDRSVDGGVQFAYAQLASQGITPPHPEDFGTYDKKAKRYVLTPEQEEEFKTADKSYLDQLFTLGKQNAQGQAWVKFIGSTVSPMSLYTTTQEKDEWTKFWNDVIVPTGFGETGYSDEQRALITSYLDDNPNSLGYATFSSAIGEKERDLPFAESLDDAVYDKYYTGERETLSPEDFSKKLMATESRRFYQNQLDTKLKEISPSLDPWELLTNGFEKSGALSQYRDQWDRYRSLNPEAAFILDDQSRMFKEANDIPTQSWEAERMSNTINGLRDLAPMLEGEEGIRPGFVKETLAALQADYSQTGEFGEPTSPKAKAVDWWFQNVMTPYVDKTTPLYEQADQMTSRGQDPSAIYDQIRVLQNEKPLTYQGKKVPTVEQVFWGNKSPEEQKAAVDGWTTRPLEWLTNFQRKKVGYDISKEGAAFLDNYSTVQNLFYGYVNSQDLTPGSNDYERAQRRNDQLAAGMAVTDEDKRLLALTKAAPFERLDAQDFAAGNSSWDQAVNLARLSTAYIEGKHLSVKGYSQDVSMPAKIFFYQSINQARADDPAFDRALDDLSLSLPLPGGQYREGALLYEAVFFGNFRTTDIPDELTSIGDGVTYGG
jgi:hypothetical protein